MEMCIVHANFIIFVQILWKSDQNLHGNLTIDSSCTEGRGLSETVHAPMSATVNTPIGSVLKVKFLQHVAEFIPYNSWAIDCQSHVIQRLYL